MKSIINNILLGSILLIGFACNESVDLVTSDAVEGGLINPTSTSVNYVVGDTGPYTVEFYVNQRSDIHVESIDIYKSFTGSEVLTAGDGSDSVVTYVADAEVMDRSITISTLNEAHYITFDYTFDELIADLTVDGSGLPTSDGDFQIGDTWSLRFVTHMSDGREIEQNFSVNMAVSTRFAGTYNVVAKQYWRIGVNRSDLDSFWPAQMVVTSIDATTYKLEEWWGPFDANQLFFQIDPTTNVITYPQEWPAGTAQVGNDQPMTRCEDGNPGELDNVPCGSSNFATIDPGGKDQLSMVFGYFTAGSGAREFYQVLEKSL